MAVRLVRECICGAKLDVRVSAVEAQRLLKLWDIKHSGLHSGVRHGPKGE